jgi:hypothetical protein
MKPKRWEYYLRAWKIHSRGNNNMSKEKADIEKLVAAGENFCVSADGEAVDVEPLSGCVVSYVDCGTKRTMAVSLPSGSHYYYGDWNGSQCIRKVYNCP